MAEIQLTLKIDGFGDDCETCCRIADQMRDDSAAGHCGELADMLHDLYHHIDDDHTAAPASED